MTIEAGQPIPSVKFQIKTECGIDEHSSDDYFGSGRTILFALPGAFTPTCSARHLPTYLEKHSAFSLISSLVFIYMRNIVKPMVFWF